MPTDFEGNPRRQLASPEQSVGRHVPCAAGAARPTGKQFSDGAGTGLICRGCSTSAVAAGAGMPRKWARAAAAPRTVPCDGALSAPALAVTVPGISLPARRGGGGFAVGCGVETPIRRFSAAVGASQGRPQPHHHHRGEGCHQRQPLPSIALSVRPWYYYSTWYALPFLLRK